MLESVIEPDYDALTDTVDEAAVSALAGNYHAVHGALVIWVGKTDGTITVLQFNNIADVVAPTKTTKLDPPVIESNRR